MRQMACRACVFGTLLVVLCTVTSVRSSWAGNGEKSTQGTVLLDDGTVNLAHFGIVTPSGSRVEMILDPALRPHFATVYQEQTTLISAQGMFWEADVIIEGVRCRARTVAVHEQAVYVLSQFEVPAQDVQVTEMLKWNARQGHWEQLGKSLFTPEANVWLPAAEQGWAKPQQ